MQDNSLQWSIHSERFKNSYGCGWFDDVFRAVLRAPMPPGIKVCDKKPNPKGFMYMEFSSHKRIRETFFVIPLADFMSVVQ